MANTESNTELETESDAESNTQPSIQVIDPATAPASFRRALAAARLALDNEARDILILDLRPRTALFDYFVIATGKSGRQLRAISDDIDDLLQKQLGDHRLHCDGYTDSRWIVLDYGDVVIHLFDREMRDFYRLEDLWDDAPRISVGPESEPRKRKPE